MFLNLEFQIIGFPASDSFMMLLVSSNGYHDMPIRDLSVIFFLAVRGGILRACKVDI